ncbi:sensor histidine kinase [Sanyastnella coralliicola]|uniref:sensor histidine kinase n=1 Tax=Sanyastnella coralliicola TaxID=3069118 RepID=UPI0027B9BA1F|nr:histidine kinase [Longitalea sp. SCSIO 12813]
MKLLGNKSKYLGFDDRIMVLLGIPVVSFIIPPLFFGQRPESFMEFCPQWGASLFFSSILWAGNRQILIEFRRKFFDKEQDKKRVALTIFFVIFFTALVNFIGFILTPPEDRLEIQGQGFGAGLFVTLFCITIYEAIWSASRLRQSRTEAEKLKRENLQSQLSMLKSQVNPHFLFNSLNTLTSIIPEDPERSVKFVQKLSNVYRCILEIRDKEVVTLEEEFNCIESYIYLLDTRFGASLKFDIQLKEEDKERFVVPLSLQILIENAIKHNVVSRKRPLTIEIFANDEGNLVVRNNLQLKDQEMEGTGTGIENIDNRFQLVSEEALEVIQTSEHFTVVLPLLTISSYESSHH